MFSLYITVLSLVIALAAATADNCYWRSDNTINAEGDGWFACNNTQVNTGGAQLCCIAGDQCGEDSICHSNLGYYVGGCTDGSYGDPVCRNSCTDDGETWIQYNQTADLWHCCGDSGCDGTVTSETFKAVAPVSWTAVASTQSATASKTASSTSTRTATASATTAAGGKGNKHKNDKDSGLSTGAIAGIVVACGVAGVTLIVAIVIWLLWRRRRCLRTMLDGEAKWQQDQQHMDYDAAAAPHYGAEGHEYLALTGQPPMSPQELAPMSPQELGNTEAARSELEADQGPRKER